MDPVSYRTSTKDPKERTICGVINEAAEASREKRENRTKPQPWIVRKLMVGFTAGIMGYTAYVYVRQLCLPMIWRRSGAPASRGTGIVLLVVFCVLYLWMVWAYIMAVITSPGYARDHVQKSERPLLPAYVPFRDSFQSTDLSHNPDIIPAPPPAAEDVEMGSYREPYGRHRSFSATTSRSQSSPYGPALQKRENGLAGPSYEDLLKRDAQQQRRRRRQSDAQETDAGMLDSIAVPKPAFMHLPNSPSPNVSSSQASPFPTPSATVNSHHRHESSAAPLNPHFKLKKPKPSLPGVSKISARPSRRAKALKQEQLLDELNITRKPTTSAVLQPVHRYCTIEGIVKPYRTHHCRVCGACVLKYDHHCPWIGQCVGARNHKFFLNFCQATVVLTSYTLGTLIAYTVISSNSSSDDDINAQQIVIIGLAGLFLLFTFLLTVSHIHLILSGQTTVESMQIRNMKEREERNLAKVFSLWQFGAKQRKLREWDQEWGRLNKEGNIWWRGNAHEEWVNVMGKNPVGWIFPTLRKGGDGLDYPVNPRFDFEGRWRKRSEWPEALK